MVRRDLAPPVTLTEIRRDAVSLPTLEVSLTAPDGREQVARLGIEPVVIGSSADCEIVAFDPRISRRHCEISLGEEGISVRDLGSKNGIFVDRVRVRDALLPPNTPVLVASSRLVVRSAGEPSVVILAPGARFGQALGASVRMRALFSRLERAAATHETILLLGESGTGKELLARGIHDASPRKNGPFVVFDCSAVAPTLVEAELFGHVKGAFTGAVSNAPGLLEEANGGTLFLDEIGELPIDLQPKLLRALEARQRKPVGSTEWKSFDARVVAATHRDLRARVAAGTFREDLYYRLAVVEANVPPLRERKDDIPLLVERFLAAQTPPRTIDDLPPHALDLLRGHRWPGNVRELRNTVLRLVLFPNAIDEAFHAQMGGAGAESSGATDLPLRAAREQVVERFERAYIEAQLKRAQGNVTRAAEFMEISRQLLHRMMEKYGVKSGGG